MNREERRRTGITKETSDKLEELKKPCTLLEAVQLAQGVADDKIKDYHNNINPIIVSLTIQIEVLKEMLFKCNEEGPVTHGSIISEQEFIDKFNERVDDYNRQKEEAIKGIQEELNKNNKSPVNNVISIKPEDTTSDVDVKIEH